MKKLIIIIALALSCAAPFMARATQYSRLGIITAAKQLGRWPQLKAWIQASGYEDEWLVCSYLSDDFPQFPAVTNAVVAAGIATPEEVAAILAASRDPALPDDLQQRHYDRAMLTQSGRRDWHGSSQTWIDTNACVRVWRYEDGYEWVEPWTRPKSDIEKAMERAAAVVAAAEARARGKPRSVADIIMDRARTEAMVITNGVDTVTHIISPDDPGGQSL